MELKDIIEQTEKLNEDEFFIYLKELQKLAEKKYNGVFIYTKLFYEPFPLNNKKEKHRHFDRFKGKIKMSDDFNEPLDDFKEYMY